MIAALPRRFCPHCGSATVLRIPEGDHLSRQVCEACQTIHYENPRLVVGCVPEHEGRILLCRRAIEPRRGFWTVPAGFMENGETLEAGAARECFEEAEASVAIESLLAVINIPEAHQVHVFFRARLTSPAHGAGAESLEAMLVDEEQIPWAEIAFPSTEFALRQYLDDRKSGHRGVHITTLLRRHPD